MLNTPGEIQWTLSLRTAVKFLLLFIHANFVILSN